MAHPPQNTARTNPNPRRDDQPESASQELAIVDLAEPWQQKAKDSRVTRFRHFPTVNQIIGRFQPYPINALVRPLK